VYAKLGGQKYPANAIDVELNLVETKGTEQWIKGRLLFVRGNAGDTQQTVGKHDWAVFLTTDTALSANNTAIVCLSAEYLTDVEIIFWAGKNCQAVFFICENN
jgi:hypothetical protein